MIVRYDESAGIVDDRRSKDFCDSHRRRVDPSLINHRRRDDSIFRVQVEGAQLLPLQILHLDSQKLLPRFRPKFAVSINNLFARRCHDYRLLTNSNGGTFESDTIARKSCHFPNACAIKLIDARNFGRNPRYR